MIQFAPDITETDLPGKFSLTNDSKRLMVKTTLNDSSDSQSLWQCRILVVFGEEILGEETMTAKPRSRLLTAVAAEKCVQRFFHFCHDRPRNREPHQFGLAEPDAVILSLRGKRGSR